MSRNLALDILLAGNERWATGTPHLALARPGSDTPLAALLCCSELGPEPEEIFDRPPGSLFVYQGAGTLVSTSAADAMGYAVGYLGVQLVMVMAHDHCKLVASHGPKLSCLDGRAPDGLCGAIWSATRAARQLSRHEDLAPAVEAGRLAIVPMVFDAESARVQIVRTH